MILFFLRLTIQKTWMYSTTDIVHLFLCMTHVPNLPVDVWITIATLLHDRDRLALRIVCQLSKQAIDVTGVKQKVVLKVSPQSEWGQFHDRVPIFVQQQVVFVRGANEWATQPWKKLHAHPGLAVNNSCEWERILTESRKWSTSSPVPSLQSLHALLLNDIDISSPDTLAVLRQVPIVSLVRCFSRVQSLEALAGGRLHTLHLHCGDLHDTNNQGVETIPIPMLPTSSWDSHIFRVQNPMQNQVDAALSHANVEVSDKLQTSGVSMLPGTIHLIQSLPQSTINCGVLSCRKLMLTSLFPDDIFEWRECPNLEVMYARYLCVSLLAQQYPKLRELRLHHCDVDLGVLATCTPQLELLEYTPMASGTETRLNVQVCNFLRLRYLILRLWTKRAYLHHLPYLQHVSIPSTAELHWGSGVDPLPLVEESDLHSNSRMKIRRFGLTQPPQEDWWSHFSNHTIISTCTKYPHWLTDDKWSSANTHTLFDSW